MLGLTARKSKFLYDQEFHLEEGMSVHSPDAGVHGQRLETVRHRLGLNGKANHLDVDVALHSPDAGVIGQAFSKFKSAMIPLNAGGKLKEVCSVQAF